MAIKLNGFVRRQEVAHELGISVSTLKRYMAALSDDEKKELMNLGYRERNYLRPQVAQYLLKLYEVEK